MAEILGLDVELLAHDSVKIKGGGKVIYFDPFQLPRREYEKADIVFISHEHFDHCSSDDLKKIIGNDTLIVASRQCKPELSKIKAKEIIYAKPGEKIELGGLSTEVVPAYNVNKFRAPNQPFHPKADEKNGYVVTISGRRVYHPGDTDVIPEMKTLRNIDIAFLPVSGTYVMTADEAVEAVNIIKPKIAIPVHYSAIVGSGADAKKFESLAKKFCEVKILI